MMPILVALLIIWINVNPSHTWDQVLTSPVALTMEFLILFLLIDKVVQFFYRRSVIDPKNILPILMDWCDELSNQPGRGLTELEMQWARLVGVARPELIKLVFVDKMPSPPPQLQKWSEMLLDVSKSSGLCLGYVIYLRTDCYSRRLLQHEFRHTHQIERNSFQEFLHEYINQVLQYGYRNSPLEQDARIWEQAVVFKT